MPYDKGQQIRIDQKVLNKSAYESPRLRSNRTCLRLRPLHPPIACAPGPCKPDPVAV
jgi:hypothetical protein